MVVEGEFDLATGDEWMRLPRGSFALVAGATSLTITGAGRLFLAAGR